MNNWIKGGKIMAMAEEEVAPTKEMNKSRSGIAPAKKS